MCSKQSFPWKCQECSVTVSPTRASVVWKIRDFSKMDTKTRDYLDSQKFEFLNATWKIEIYPGADSYVGEVMLFLVRVSSTIESQNVKYKFFYRDKFTDEYLAQEFVRKFNKNEEYRPVFGIKRKNTGHGTLSRIKFKDLLDGELRDLLLAEDTLTVCCEVEDADAGEPEDPPTEAECPVSSFKALIRDFGNICEKESHSDVRLKVGETEFPAHRSILAARSTVFASVLKENPSPEVIELDVEDCSIVKDFLLYVYTGKLGELSSASVPKLFAAANTYELVELQQECLMFMKAHFCPYNVCDFANLASKYENADLMARAKTFFNEKANLVISSKRWPNFVKECPLLASDLLQYTVEIRVEGKRDCCKSEHKKLLEDLSSVYEEVPFPDVTLKVASEEFPAHKAILSRRSSVFRGMFEANMKENQERVVDIREMEAQSVKEMLRYIYTGHLCDLDQDSAKNLYVAADRYDLQELKTHCEQYLSSNVSVDNVCQLALLADLHSDNKLKTAVRLFLGCNQQEVLKSAVWTNFATEKPSFFLQLITSAILCVGSVSMQQCVRDEL